MSICSCPGQFHFALSTASPLGQISFALVKCLQRDKPHSGTPSGPVSNPSMSVILRFKRQNLTIACYYHYHMVLTPLSPSQCLCIPVSLFSISSHILLIWTLSSFLRDSIYLDVFWNFLLRAVNSSLSEIGIPYHLIGQHTRDIIRAKFSTIFLDFNSVYFVSCFFTLSEKLFQKHQVVSCKLLGRQGLFLHISFLLPHQWVKLTAFLSRYHSLERQKI